MKLGLLLIDFIVILLAWSASYYFFVAHFTWADFLPASVATLPLLFGIKTLVFVRFGLYRAILRYASFRFATTIVKAISVGSALSYLAINYPNVKWPIGLMMMDFLVTLLLVGITRFLPRYFQEQSLPDSSTKREILIYGAGDIGDAVARTLLKPHSEYTPVGFLDDDPRKMGRKVHNLPIFGGRNELGTILKKYHVREIIIAMRSITPETLRDFIKECRAFNVFCRIAPKFSDMLNHDVSIKNIDIADLLKRDPKDLDEKQIDRFLHGKRILITGAAGSIGSELVRQALRFKPKSLTLIDLSEYGLYKIEEELRPLIEKLKGHCRFNFALMDVNRRETLDSLVKKEKPEIVFHAAAYKHVPMIEANPFSGIINNIQGTVNVADLSDQYGVEKFVLISTDKAVRPTNVMGTTKRICELYIQNLSLRSKTEYVAVRFGNVLGSSGSVIPKFLEQIKEGGPLTVTHPQVTRYFMLIQEAVSLVMQAASIGHGGEIFILNMGNPVSIREMAEDLIFLAGKIPYKEIDVQFTGLRPGEKLYEELLIDEAEKKTQYENITIGKMTVMDWTSLNDEIQILLSAARKEDKAMSLNVMSRLVPEFTHVELVVPAYADNILPLKPKVSST